MRYSQGYSQGTPRSALGRQPVEQRAVVLVVQAVDDRQLGGLENLVGQHHRAEERLHGAREYPVSSP